MGKKFVDGGSKEELKAYENTHIAKSVEIPDDLVFIKKADTNFEDKKIDVECIRSINNAIKKQKEKD